MSLLLMRAPRSRVGLAAFIVTCAWLAFAHGSSADAASPSGSRSYQLVSPPDKNGADAIFILPTFASRDGTKFVLSSSDAFAGGRGAAANQYLAEFDGEGWESAPLSLTSKRYNPNAVSPGVGFSDFSCEGCARVVGTSLDSAAERDNDPKMLGDGNDVYESGPGGNLKWLSGGPIGGNAPVDARFGGRSVDGGKVAFDIPEVLVDDVLGISAGANIAYVAENGEPQIVGVDDAGVPFAGGSVIGSAGRAVGNAISDDGETVFFESPDPLTVGSPHLYMRAEGRTIDVSAPQCTRAGCGSGIVEGFEGASRDGQFVVFSSYEQLVDDDTDAGSDIYMYDRQASRLSRISGGETGLSEGGVIGLSAMAEDASRIYFVSLTELTRDSNIYGNVAQSGGINLYMYERGGSGIEDRTTFIASGVDAVSLTTLAGREASRSLSLTPDGRVLLFQSYGNLIGDTQGTPQVYRFASETSAFDCISCPTGEVGAEGRLAGLSGERPFRPLRNVTDDGETAFFETAEQLVPEDVNQRADVYEWRDGAVQLVSSGESSAASFFLDASADGRRVFFASYDRLTAEDHDGAADVYVATAGGSDKTPELSNECFGDPCQGPQATAPLLPLPGTETTSGSDDAGDESASSATLEILPVSARQVLRASRTGVLPVRVRAGQSGAVVTVVATGRGRRASYRLGTGRGLSTRRSLTVRVEFSRRVRSRMTKERRLVVTLRASAEGSRVQSSVEVGMPKVAMKKRAAR